MVTVIESILAEVAENLPEGIKHPPKFKVVMFRNSPTAGRAQGINTIKINADLAELYPDQLRDTVIHEVAHCLVHLNYDYRCKPHGAEWQDMMAQLGIGDIQRCHRMEQPDLRRKEQRTHRYVCNCREYQLTTTRHNKVLFKGRTYRCTSCKGNLEYRNG